MFEIDESTLPFVRTRGALLVLDLQNEFSSSGQLPVEQPPGFTDNILKILPDFRTSGSVIWIRSVFEASRPVNSMEGDTEKVVTDKELIPRLNQEESLRNARRRISETQNGRTGKSGAINDRALELANAILVADEDEETIPEEAFLTTSPGGKPQFVLPGSAGIQLSAAALGGCDSDRDIVFEKSYYSAFKDGTLVQFLRSKFITEIYICGALTNISVYATVVDAAQFGLAITLIDDCLGYRSKERHDESLRRLLVSTGCDNITSTELVQDLKRKAKMAQKQAAPAPRRARREPSKKMERKAKEPELESMMSKLNLTPDASTASGRESFSSPPRPNPVPPLAVDTEGGGGSFGSVESESQDLRLSLHSTRRSGGDNRNPERVANKIKTRKRPSKKPTQNSSQISTDCTKPSLAEQLPPPAKDSSNSIESTPKKMPHDIAPDEAAQLTADAISGKSAAAKLDQTEEQEQHAFENRTQSSKSTTQASNMKVEKPLPSTKERPEPICEGDTTIITNLLKGDLVEGIFEKIRDEVKWQKMSHQGGDVPRLVAVQGKITDDGSIPIYRHPADESPPLLPFSKTVSLIREEAEKELGHPLNHVLIQFYRDSTDYISEHSDKTLDIVPKTFIVNVSLGAQRTMIFRTKKQNSSGAKAPEPTVPRRAVRAPMPHNSMCKVGLVTNMRWLHGIRQDKRLPSEKSDAELAYQTARISLTFRQIGTFLSKDQQKIWGQGAVSKSQSNANFVINGNTPEAEKMIRAFGQENHSSEFDWAAHYGSGFDVLHLNNTPKLFLSGDRIADSRVKLALAQHGIKWEEGKLSPSFIWKDGDLTTEASEIPGNPSVKFVDNDLSKSTTTGDMAILLYLDAVYGPKCRTQLEIARIYTRLQYVAEAPTKSKTASIDTRTWEQGMGLWEAFSKGEHFMAGKDASIIDWMILPLLDEIHDKHGFGEGFEAVEAYYTRLRATESVVAALGPLKPKNAVADIQESASREEGGKEVANTAEDDDEEEDEDS